MSSALLDPGFERLSIGQLGASGDPCADPPAGTPGQAAPGTPAGTYSTLLTGSSGQESHAITMQVAVQ